MQSRAVINRHGSSTPLTRMQPFHLWLISALALAASVQAAPALTLVLDGRPNATVVLADRPSAAAKRGAALLVAQIERTSGAKLPVVAEGTLRDVTISNGTLRATAGAATPAAFVLIGESAVARQLGASSDGLGAGGILIRTLSNALVLLGADDKTPADPDGSRYAVTTWLEDALGFRMLWPGELGLVAPRRRTVTIPAMDRSFTPLIGQRQIRNAHYNDRVQAGLDYLGVKKAGQDQAEAVALGTSAAQPGWFDWQRLGGKVGIVGGHAFGEVWDKYHAEHPEWFALQPNGSRDLAKLTPARARLCKSNLALIEALARDKIAELDRSGAKSISLAPNDGGSATFCMCADCKKLDPPEGRKIQLWDLTASPRRDFDYVSLTDRMVWFWNQLATRITAKHPDALLTVYAYSAYLAPPVREKLHPNLVVGFVGMNYRRAADREQARQDWSAWAAAAQKLYWRPNLLLFARREGTSSLYAHKLAEDLRTFAHHSLIGTDFDSCMHHWATEGVNYYVLARLLWNPDADVDAILDDYCQSGFGGAAREVRRYLARIEELTNEIAARDADPPSAYTPAVVAGLRSMLVAADRLADDETVRRRVAFLRRGLEFTALQNRTHGLVARNAVQPLTTAEKAELKGLQQEKWLFMRRIFREEPLAVNVPMVAWGSEGAFRAFGWSGAKSVSKSAIDADEEGRPVEVSSKK
jgi:hypothetical protein